MAKRPKSEPNLETAVRRRLARHMATRPRESIRLYPLPTRRQRSSHTVVPLYERLEGMTSRDAKTVFNDLMRQISVLNNKIQVVHANIHPSNIMLINGKPHLSDFKEAQDFRRDKTTRPISVATSLFLDVESILYAFKGKIPDIELMEGVEDYLRRSTYGPEVEAEIANLVRRHYFRDFRSEEKK